MHPAQTLRNPEPTGMPAERAWVRWVVQRIEADFQRSADTHLLPLDLPSYGDVRLYLKDESSHPTGSLKHRLARSLFLYALCNGWLRPGCCVVEASSGSTAISEAYFARLLRLPFVAVMPRHTSAAKVAAIRAQGGECHAVDDPLSVYAVAEQLARLRGGHFMDQFTHAERATDWRANNNIAESIFDQMRLEPEPVPCWIVAGAGTGGTLATLGRYVRYRGHGTRVCGVDAERSVLFDHYVSGDQQLRLACGSRIEGIGRPRVEPSFMPAAIDEMVQVPDALSIGAMHALSRRLGRRVGASTGSNLVASLLCERTWRGRGSAGRW
jgi:cysteine synthase A